MNSALEVLISRHLDGEATPEETRRLDGRLHQEAEALSALFLAAAHDTLLREALAQGAAAQSPPTSRRRRWAMAAIAVAAAALLAVAGLALLRGRSRGPQPAAACGVAVVEVKTSKGMVVRVWTGADVREFFAHDIDSDELVRTLRLRIESMGGKADCPYDSKMTRDAYRASLVARMLADVQLLLSPEVRDSRVLGLLVGLLNDPDFRLRGAACDALIRLGDRRALPDLLGALRARKVCNGSLVPAIAALGDGSAVPALIDTIPLGGAIETAEQLRAIEAITGLSLDPVRNERGGIHGLGFYSEGALEQFRRQMHEWWKANQDKARSGMKRDGGTPAP